MHLTAPLRRSAFTLVELLIVISIIALLAGMSFAALGLLGTKAKTSSTEKLIRELAHAVTLYMNDHRLLGSEENEEGRTAKEDFEARPWYYLYTKPREEGKDPYIDLTAKNLSKGDFEAPAPANIKDATSIRDYWGDNLRFLVKNAENNGISYTEEICILSRWGEPEFDRGYHLHIDGEWEWIEAPDEADYDD